MTLTQDRRPLSLTEALTARRSTRVFGKGPIAHEALSRVIEIASVATDADNHRAAPSAHARYPVSVCVATRQVSGLTSGLWSADGPSSSWTLQREGDFGPALAAAAIGDQPWVGEASAVAILRADLDDSRRAFADQPPAGERGPRYVWIEAGAIAQNMALVAAGQGLGAVLVAGFDDARTQEVLGLDGERQALVRLCIGLLPDDGGD